jgi:hypothetical protein
MRFFNTARPVDCHRHYCLPPLERFDLSEVEMLIEQQRCFVLHAPGHTGKASCLKDVFSEEKILRREQEYQGWVIMVWGM